MYRPVMRFLKLALFLLGAVCIAPSTARTETRSLSQQLRDAANGQPVLLANRYSVGVVARSPDGAFDQVIVPDRGALSYDPALELLWLYDDDGTLSVLDLRLPQPVPVPIVENGPRERGAIVVVRSGRADEPGLYLRWTRKPRIFVEKLTPASVSPAFGMSPEEIADENALMARQAGEARIVGREWLVKSFARRARKTAQRQQRFDRRVRVALDECRAKTCGRAARLRKSGLLWVVTGDQADHDAAWVSCDIFDPGSRKWAYPEEASPLTWGDETSGSAGGYTCRPRFDASESAYLLGFQACELRSGCTKLEKDSALAWLDPGVELVPPRPESPHPW